MRALPFRLLLLLPALAVLTSGCAALTSREEIHRRLPPASFVTVAGQSVYVEQSGEGPPVLLLHGFGASSYLWRDVVPELRRHHRVIAPDLTGFGWTDRPAGMEPYTYAGETRLVIGLLDALGVARADLVGHSWGGGLALVVAHEHPDRVRSLVLVANTLPVYGTARRGRAAALRPLNRWLLGFFLRPGYVRRGLEAAYYDPSRVSDATVAEYLARLRVEGVEEAYHGLTAPLPQALRPAPVDLATITTPALVVWGRQDTLIELEIGRRNAARLPHARFEILERCGHVPMEEKPEELLALMLPFLDAAAR